MEHNGGWDGLPMLGEQVDRRMIIIKVAKETTIPQPHTFLIRGNGLVLILFCQFPKQNTMFAIIKPCGPSVNVLL